METTLTTRGSIGSKRVPKLNMQELVSVVNQRYEKALVSIDGPMCLLHMCKHMGILCIQVCKLAFGPFYISICNIGKQPWL